MKDYSEDIEILTNVYSELKKFPLSKDKPIDRIVANAIDALIKVESKQDLVKVIALLFAYLKKTKH